jgi:hypothetical protein
MNLLAAIILTSGLAAPAPEFKTATNHPMQYLLSLPTGWKAGKTWPVVLVIESANRDFAATAREFESARGSMPFILVTPFVLTGGGPSIRDVPSYRYTASTWTRIDRDGPWKFDDEGVGAVLADVRRLYGGDRAMITGWEAGGHTLFGLSFNHPNQFKAAAPVCPNYAARWISPATEKAAGVPMRCFVGARDEMWARFSGQRERARLVARARGFSDLTTTRVQGKGHEPLAGAVLSWFHSRE